MLMRSHLLIAPLLLASLVLLAPSSAFSEDEPVSVEQARRQELQVLREVADLALLPPRLNTSPLPEYALKNLGYGMTIGIAQTPSGRIYNAWIGGEDGPKAYMLVNHSDDDGQTWSEPDLVIDSRAAHLPIPRSVIVGNLWTDPLGRLWVFFDQTMNHFDGRGGLWCTRCDKPDADKLEWTTPERIWHGSMLNKPIVNSKGEWLLFAQLLQSNGIGPFSAGVFPELDSLRGASILVSTNEGKTWTRRGGVKMPNPNWMEHRAIEREDGSLWMLVRTTKGAMLTISQDGGKSWSTPDFPAGIKHPAARFFLEKLKSGRWLLVKHGKTIDNHEGRSHLSAWLSDDEGTTWQGGLMLDERRGVSYPDGFQADDGSIYISYDWQRGSKGHVNLAKFTEADILAGTLVSKDSRLKQPIIRPGKLNPELYEDKAQK